MRILFFTDTYPPQVNGVSVVTALTVQGLARRGWACAVVAPRYPGAPAAADDGIRQWSVPSFALPGYADIRVARPGRTRHLARDIARRHQPDIVHGATEFLVGRLGLSAARALGVPMCTSYHTDFAKYTAAYGVPWLRGPVTRWIARFHAHADRVFTPSLPARDELRRLGVPDVEVWGRGVDADLFHPSHRSGELREGFKLGGSFTFLHVGRLAPEKGVSILLDAFAQLEHSLPAGSVRLVVAGAGPSLAALRRRATPSVVFLGNVDRQRELPVLYASADAFVFASTTETLGLVVLEAMASGLPVIATPAGGVADHLEHERNGLAYPAHDVASCAAAMRRLVEDRALTCRLRAGARATAERRSWEQELDRLDASYREVLSRRREA